MRYALVIFTLLAISCGKRRLETSTEADASECDCRALWDQVEDYRYRWREAVDKCEVNRVPKTQAY